MIKRIVLVLLIASLSAMLFTALAEINRHDLSTQKAATCNLKVKGPVYLVTYADGDVYIANAKVLGESALNNCVDVVHMYRKKHLDEEFVEKNKKILSAKRGAGYWLWKPYLILKTLQKLPENSVVVYLDSGFKIMKPLDGFINNVSDVDIALVDNPPFLNKEYVKRDLFRYMGMDNEKARNAEQLSAGMLVVRNTAHARGFLQKWLEIGEVPGLIDDSSSKDEYPEFLEHRHDQSILSLLYLQNPDGIKIVPSEEILSVAWLHKRRSFQKSLYVTRSGPKMQMSILGKRLDEMLGWMRKVEYETYK